MACRHLYIDFLENGDVKYEFFRHHSKFMLYSYLIKWPAEQIDIIGGQGLEDHNFRRITTPDGFLRLEWDKVSEAETKVGRSVDYIKRGFLKYLSGEPALWGYSERINIKPDFSLWLHSPYERLNAIQRRSTAVFFGKDGQEQNYRPRELSQRVFNQKGVLKVNWTLELLDDPKKAW